VERKSGKGSVSQGTHTSEAVAAKNRGILDRISVAKTISDLNESDGV
jgi:hypothetical protein